MECAGGGECGGKGGEEGEIVKADRKEDGGGAEDGG